MNIISRKIRIDLTEKKSKFITRLMVISSEKEAESFIKEITLAEKGAVHNCYAFRLVKDDGSIYEKKSDDGEPGGTAGAPMLAVLNGSDLVNTLAVTTRYFGGIKLGTGGLVNVYKKGVNEALKLSGMKEFRIYDKYKLTFPINETGHCLYLLKKENIGLVSKNFGDDVEFIINVDKESLDSMNEICKIVKGHYEKMPDNE